MLAFPTNTRLLTRDLLAVRIRAARKDALQRIGADRIKSSGWLRVSTAAHQVLLEKLSTWLEGKLGQRAVPTQTQVLGVALSLEAK